MLENFIFSVALSSHLGITGDWNNIHPRIGYENNNCIAGIYQNSESTISVYAGGKFYFHNRLNLEYGFVSGYSQYQIAPMLKLNYNNFFVAPAKSNDQIGVVVGVEVKF